MGLVSIRRSLLRPLLLLIGLLGAGAVAATLLASRSAIDALAGASMGQTLEAAEARLDGFFGAVAGELGVLRDWGADGLLSLDDPQRLTRQLAPVLRAHPQVVSVLVADESGREHLLTRREQSWGERRLAVDAEGGHARWREWTDTAPLPVERTEDSDYDPRLRPWFLGATRADGELHWTAPYVFYRAQVPGLTVAVRWRDPSGRAHVVGLDLLLDELSEFTTALEPSQRGIGYVTTLEGQLLGLPRHPRFESVDARRAALLELPEDLGIPLLSDAVDNWLEHGEPLGVPMRFRSSGEPWWGQAQPYELGGAPSALVVAVVPEADLVGNLNTVRLTIAGLTLAALLLAGLHAGVVARRLSAPIEALARGNQRIGRGELDPGQPVTSHIREVEELALAQDQMREALRSLLKVERELELARDIQQHTLPEQLPEIPGYAIAGWSEPAEETGGDSYDVVGFRPGASGGANQLVGQGAQRALCLLADAAGHGVGAALSVTQVRAMVRMALRSGADPRAALHYLSEQLSEDLPPGRFVTAWIGVLDAEAHTLAGFSAGQAPLFLLRAASGQVEELAADAPPLGLLSSQDVVLPPALPLEPGDLFAAISDGVFDLTDASGQRFGEERVQGLLTRHAAAGPEALVAALRSALDEFAAGTSAPDDRTVLLIQRLA